MNMIKTTARACVIHKNMLLLVTNDNSYWYLPGGHQNPKEPLKDCVEREVFEETGLEVSYGDILFCSEFYDENISSHKVEIIFVATPINSLPSKWIDTDNSVSKSKFFKIDELSSLNVQPAYLKKFDTFKSKPNHAIYRGVETNQNKSRD
jgi:ADP-ribose pyrophosphatase YjhB (NUDIX family)